MANTYTRTLTEEERMIRDLNELVYKEIEKSFEERPDAGYPYRALSEDRKILDSKPMNLFAEGVLLGEDFHIYKREGLTQFPGTDINYTYISETGEIHSFGEDYASCYARFPGDIKIKLTDFATHPEVEDFITSVSNKLGKKKEEKVGHKL